MTEERPSLYNKYWALTEEGGELAQIADQLIKPLFTEYLAKGYSAMEISRVLVDEVLLREAHCRLQHGYELSKQERATAEEAKHATGNEN